MKYQVQSIRGKRPYMEDRYAVLPFNEGSVIIGLVTDGHSGSKVTDHLSSNLPFLLLKSIRRTVIETRDAIYTTIYNYAKTFINDRSGSTLTGFLSTSKTVYVFNIGDSRTCFYLKKDSKPKTTYSFWCTTDHTSTDPLEVKRVIKNGGKITSDGRLNGILAMTRSIGDTGIGPGLSCEPDVFWFERKNIAGPILMYSDGVYENVKDTSRELYQMAIKYGVETLVNYSTTQGSQDNITAVLVKL